MLIKDYTQEQLSVCNSKIGQYIKDNFELLETKYVNLGCKTVRILNYSKDFTPLIKKQLTYSLKNSSENYDATIVLWNEKHFQTLFNSIDDKFNPKKNIRMRVEILSSKRKYVNFCIKDYDFSSMMPILDMNFEIGVLTSYDKNTNTYYYGVENLEPEEFIKHGHIFVQIFNRILKTDNSNIVHGAVVGMNNNGILFCARGQRGKSTLTVLSMMEGFEYVSDDYLTLEKEGNSLYSYPIYSIITLSPRMYNELYDRLDGCRFVSNNARKDKYVVNISKFHPQFKSKYPIKLCIFPEIVSDKDPSICLCNKEEKGRAIVQLVQSTVSQMQDLCDQHTILKLLNMVKDFEFYKLNLCNDIERNTQYLKEFISKYEIKKSTVSIDKMLVDITFDIANILDSENGFIYTMNKFATNIYENLMNGVSQSEIAEYFETNLKYDIKNQLEQFVNQLKSLGLYDVQNKGLGLSINLDFAREDKCKLSITKYDSKQIIELIKEEKENELCVK